MRRVSARSNNITLKYIGFVKKHFSLNLSSYILRILKSKFVSFSLSILKFGVVLGGGGGGQLSGEDGRGGRGGADAAADRDGGGVLIGVGGGEDAGSGGGGRAVTKDSIKDLSKLTLFFLLGVHGDGGGDGGRCLPGGGVLIGDEGGGAYKEEEAEAAVRSSRCVLTVFF